MEVRDALPVEQVPTVRLARWRVYETVDSGHRHFAGHNLDLGIHRVSSAITAYDPVLRRGRTESGRVYELLGEPAPEPDADAERAWQVWCALNGVPAAVDVTHEYVVAPPKTLH